MKDASQALVAARAAAADAPDDLDGDRRFDRELSWLAFNARVLALAVSDDVPLLERVKFLAIYATNLDEFFMVRVPGLLFRSELSTGGPSSASRLTDVDAALLAWASVRALSAWASSSVRCLTSDAKCA